MLRTLSARRLIGHDGCADIGLTTAAPGSAEGGLIVSDIEAAHHELAGRGIDVSDIWHGPPFSVEARQPGRDPERTSYGSFFYFTDPDGNTWLVQEVTTRRPGVMNAGETGYVSTQDLLGRLRCGGRGNENGGWMRGVRISDVSHPTPVKQALGAGSAPVRAVAWTQIARRRGLRLRSETGTCLRPPETGACLESKRYSPRRQG